MHGQPRDRSVLRGPGERDRLGEPGRPLHEAPHQARSGQVEALELQIAADHQVAGPQQPGQRGEGLGFEGWLPVDHEETEFMIDLMDTLLAD